MSTIRRNSKGEVKAWITACEDASNIAYSRDDVRAICGLCGLTCGVDSKEPLRCWVRVEPRRRPRSRRGRA